MNHNVEVEITPTEKGLLIQKRATEHPGDRIAGILDDADFDVDEYIEDIRGR